MVLAAAALLPASGFCESNTGGFTPFEGFWEARYTFSDKSCHAVIEQRFSLVASIKAADQAEGEKPQKSREYYIKGREVMLEGYMLELLSGGEVI